MTTRHTADVVAVATDPLGVRRILLIQRRKPPYQGGWALPGGHRNPHESPLDAAVRELEEETGIRVDPRRVVEVGCYDTPGRDPRGHYSTTAYLAVLDELPVVVAADDAEDARWWPLLRLPELAFDHGVIVDDALRVVCARVAGWAP